MRTRGKGTKIIFFEWSVLSVRRLLSRPYNRFALLSSSNKTKQYRKEPKHGEIRKMLVNIKMSFHLVLSSVLRILSY